MEFISMNIGVTIYTFNKIHGSALPLIKKNNKIMHNTPQNF